VCKGLCGKRGFRGAGSLTSRQGVITVRAIVASALLLWFEKQQKKSSKKNYTKFSNANFQQKGFEGLGNFTEGGKKEQQAAIVAPS